MTFVSRVCCNIRISTDKDIVDIGASYVSIREHMKKKPTATKWLGLCSTWRKELDVDKWELGNIMRMYRESRGKSLRQVAATIGITPPYLSDCERGFRKLDLTKLQKFIEACG